MGPTTQVAESTNMATEAVRPFVPRLICQKSSLQPLETLMGVKLFPVCCFLLPVHCCLLVSIRILYHVIAEMCLPRFMWLQREEEEEEPLTEMEQYVQYNQLQWELYNELYSEVYTEGVFGDYLTFLLSELEDGPYWSDVKQ